jgi:hypothetical protein
LGLEGNPLHAGADQGGMHMVETKIDRKPGDCDFDIDEVCKDVKLQNRLGNRLKSWTITKDKITLQYE